MVSTKKSTIRKRPVAIFLSDVKKHLHFIRNCIFDHVEANLDLFRVAMEAIRPFLFPKTVFVYL